MRILTGLSVLESDYGTCRVRENSCSEDLGVFLVHLCVWNSQSLSPFSRVLAPASLELGVGGESVTKVKWNEHNVQCTVRMHPALIRHERTQCTMHSANASCIDTTYSV